MFWLHISAPSIVFLQVIYVLLCACLGAHQGGFCHHRTFYRLCSVIFLSGEQHCVCQSVPCFSSQPHSCHTDMS